MWGVTNGQPGMACTAVEEAGRDVNRCRVKQGCVRCAGGTGSEHRAVTGRAGASPNQGRAPGAGRACPAAFLVRSAAGDGWLVVSTASGVGQQDPLEPLASAASSAASGVWRNTLVGSTRCLTCKQATRSGQARKWDKLLEPSGPAHADDGPTRCLTCKQSVARKHCGAGPRSSSASG